LCLGFAAAPQAPAHRGRLRGKGRERTKRRASGSHKRRRDHQQKHHKGSGRIRFGPVGETAARPCTFEIYDGVWLVQVALVSISKLWVFSKNGSSDFSRAEELFVPWWPGLLGRERIRGPLVVWGCIYVKMSFSLG